MTEQQFLDECDDVLSGIEDALDAADVDVDSERSGQVLTLEFEDRSKVIVNGNAPMRELWIAARSGGFHFSKRDGVWVDTRSGDEFYAALSRLISQQAATGVLIAPRRS